MTALMEYKTLNDRILEYSTNIVFEELTVQELIELALNNGSDLTRIRSRQELINRGKDNIQLRITIKKLCKIAISDLEVLLKRFDSENNADKKTAKLYKNQFLNTISLLDKLQLEWQKYDLALKY